MKNSIFILCHSDGQRSNLTWNVKAFQALKEECPGKRHFMLDVGRKVNDLQTITYHTNAGPHLLNWIQTDLCVNYEHLHKNIGFNCEYFTNKWSVQIGAIR